MSEDVYHADFDFDTNTYQNAYTFDQDLLQAVRVLWNPFTFALAGTTGWPSTESMLVVPTVARLYKLTLESESMLKIWLWQLELVKQAWP